MLTDALVHFWTFKAVAVGLLVKLPNDEDSLNLRIRWSQ